MNQNELTHYGVLGMKWGVHRARKKGTTYKYKSHSTKKYERKVEKAKEKGNVEKQKKMQQRLNRSKQYDKNAQKIAESKTGGEAFIKSQLAGGFLNYSAYTRMNASWVSKGKAMILTSLTGPLGGYAAKSLYIRRSK